MPESASAEPPSTPHSQTIMLVTGLSGGGKSTILRALEDLGWEVVDNLPIRLLKPLLATPHNSTVTPTDRPLAVGVDSRTRGFEAEAIVKAIKALRDDTGNRISTLYVDCSGSELERRYSETRRRHPLAEDRPVADGIAQEREMMAPLRRWADQILDTTGFTSNDLQQEVRHRFSDMTGLSTTITVMSFGFARGLPRNADLVFDMRFLRNPHWDAALRPGTGLDAQVAAYVQADPAYETAVSQIENLLLTLLPRYQQDGKSYVTIAIGCTGGRHRSVHVSDRIGQFLTEHGFAPTVIHRDLLSKAQDGLEGKRPKP